MPNVFRILRSSVSGARPAGRQPGEIYVNFADGIMGYIDAAGQPVDLGGNSGGAVTLSVAPPASPQEGDLWFDMGATLRLFVWDTQFWVDASPALGAVPDHNIVTTAPAGGVGDPGDIWFVV